MENSVASKRYSPDSYSGEAPVRNSILRSLAPGEFALLRNHLEPVDLPRQSLLQDAGEKIEHIYFLNEGTASLVVLTSDGRSVEVGIVGNEGVVGTPIVAGLTWTPHRTIMQVDGEGLRIESAALGRILPSLPELHQQWNHYALIQGLQIAQIAACNRLHEVDKRLARWLLMCQDRISTETVQVTHEFLAQMLGTGRPSITVAAGLLQRDGVIENLRGAVRIVDRVGLEKAACECYLAIQRFKSVTKPGKPERQASVR